jgi:hypothetical protein
LRYAVAKINEQDLWQSYIGDCAWAGGTDFRFFESNEPKKQSKYKARATLPRWHEVRYPKSNGNQARAGDTEKASTPQEVIDLFRRKAPK